MNMVCDTFCKLETSGISQTFGRSLKHLDEALAQQVRRNAAKDRLGPTILERSRIGCNITLFLQALQSSGMIESENAPSAFKVFAGKTDTIGYSVLGEKMLMPIRQTMRPASVTMLATSSCSSESGEFDADTFVKHF